MPSQSSEPEQPSSRPSVLTLAIASASSVVAAIVVSRIWGPGTVIGAAATPVIITLVGELLKKPAEKITVVRVSPTGTEVHERSVRGDGAASADRAAHGELSQRSVHRSRRRPVAIALATGLLAFVIGAVVLTSSELVLGDSSVASGGKRTTVFGGGTRERPSTRETEPPATTTQTTTQTVPAPTAPADPEAGPGQTTSTETTTTPPTETTPPDAPAQPATPPPETGATTP